MVRLLGILMIVFGLAALVWFLLQTTALTPDSTGERVLAAITMTNALLGLLVAALGVVAVALGRRHAAEEPPVEAFGLPADEPGQREPSLRRGEKAWAESEGPSFRRR